MVVWSLRRSRRRPRILGCDGQADFLIVVKSFPHRFAPGYISQCISSVNNQEDADESHTQTSVPSSVPALELWEAESHTMLARLKLGKVTPESRLRVGGRSWGNGSVSRVLAAETSGPGF